MKLSTKISGAEAPEEIPIVLHLSISRNGATLSECIKVDFLHPEFILFGQDDDWALKTTKKFYKTN